MKTKDKKEILVNNFYYYVEYNIPRLSKVQCVKICESEYVFKVVQRLVGNLYLSQSLSVHEGVYYNDDYFSNLDIACKQLKKHWKNKMLAAKAMWKLL